MYMTRLTLCMMRKKKSKLTNVLHFQEPYVVGSLHTIFLCLLIFIHVKYENTFFIFLICHPSI